MRINFTQFQQIFGNRFVGKLTSPRIFKLTRLNLPNQFAYHYLGNASDEVGPSQTNPLFNNTKQRMPLYSYMDVVSRLGTLQIRSYNQLFELRNHIKQNRRFIIAPDLKKVKPNPIIPIVMNYALADKRYKYLGAAGKVGYYKSSNILNTLLKGTMDLYNAHGDFYQQFIFIDVPPLEEIPRISDLKRGLGTVDLKFFSLFNSVEKILIFELWKWLSKNRDKSLLKNMPNKLLDKINIVFTSGSVFTVYNLGLLNIWRTSEENVNGKMDATMMAKNFILMLAKLNLANSGEMEIELTEEERVELEKTNTDDFKGTEDETPVVKSQSKESDLDKDDGLEDAQKQNLSDTEEDDNREEPTHQTQSRLADEDIKSPDIDELELKQFGSLPDDIISELIDDDEEEEIPQETKTNTINIAELTSSKIVKLTEEQEDEFETVIDTKLDTDDVLNLKQVKIEEIPVLVSRPTTQRKPEDTAKIALERIARQQNMSVSKYDSLRKTIGKYRNITLTKDDKITVGEMIDVKPEELLFTEEEKKISTLKTMDEKYINEFMERDVAAMLVGVQSAGAIVQDIKKQDVENIAGGYTSYSMKIKPIEGEASTVRVKIPKVDSNGRFKIGNKTYLLKKQRTDLPIRKINSNTVALTSYFGKTFIKRYELRSFNYEKWLIGQIRKNAFDTENHYVKETRSGDVFDNKLKAPYVFSLLSQYFRAITTKDCFIYLDRQQADKRFTTEFVREAETKGLMFCGSYQNKFALGVNDEGEFFWIKDNQINSLGTIENLCGIDGKKAPTEAVSVDIMGKAVPVFLLLGYQLGLTKLLAALKPKYYRTAKADTHLKLLDHEYAIKFADFTLILSKKDRMTSLILSGLNLCKNLNEFSIYSLDKKDVYFNLLESINIPGRYTKEIDLYYQMFVDPITERILIEMNEPTDFGGLLIRSVELLETMYHPDEVDMSGQRIRGFERLPGEIYRHLVKALREHNRHGIKANYPIELNPEAVWMSINKDTTKLIEETLNPIQDLKQQEITTFSGNGGRSKQSMVKRTRAHHKNAIGIISEASVDSSDSGNVTYLSANPKFKSLYGIPENSGTEEVNENLTPENVLSTNALMMPASDTDDPKRVLFSGTQIGHSLAITNAKVLPTRTGYDAKLVERCSDTFASVMDQDGIVKEINDYAIVVEYKDGSTRQVELGRQFGHSGGFTTPHDVITTRKVGDKLKKGDFIAYHEGFFEEDKMNPGKLAMKLMTLTKVALIEHPFTFEDSTAISKKLADETKVKTTVEKEVVINFEQSIHRIATPGTKVSIDDPLCFIEDSVTQDAALFDEESIDLLRNLSQAAPRSSVNGIIDKIEIFYNGDKEDMSESLLKIVNRSDTKIMAKLKAMGKKPYTGMVDETYRVNGNPLMIDTAVIVFTISSESGLISGDKVAYGNQLKATIGHVFDDPPKIDNHGEFGEDIDCIFGSNSVYNRIVNSPFLIGMSNTLLIEMSKKIANEYFGNKK